MGRQEGGGRVGGRREAEVDSGEEGGRGGEEIQEERVKEQRCM